MYIDSSIEENLYSSMQKIASILNFDIVILMIFDSEKAYALEKKIYIKESIKFDELTSKIIPLSQQIPINIIDMIIIEEKTIFLNYSSLLNDITNINDLKEIKYKSLIDNIKREVCIPLFIDSNNIVGCVYSGSFTDMQIKEFLPAAIIDEINNINVIFQIFYKTLKTKLDFLDLFHIFSEILRQKESFMVSHLYNVAHWAQLIAQQMSLTDKEIEKIYMCAILHDIGKVYIDKDILGKTSSLESEEYDAIKQHPNYSYIIANDLIKYIDYGKHVPTIIKHHHERYDGTGYPDGLSGEQIPIESRILAISDSIDAMLSERCYKKPMPISDVIKELIRNKRKQFDPDIVTIAVNLLSNMEKYYLEVLKAPILWATITIYTRKDVISTQGSLINTNSEYKFRSDKYNFSKYIDKDEIVKINLYIESRKNIYEFSIKSFYFNESIMYISKIEVNPTMDTFSILWDLSGQIINFENNHDVEIYKISGNSLSFFIRDEVISDTIKNSLSIIKIFFEDSTNLEVVGKIVDSYQISNKTYFNFQYVNIQESTRDSIFKQIFKKQIEKKKLLFNNNE